MENNQKSNQRIATGLFWKLGERLISQGVSFIVSLILARLLLPEDYGAVSIVLVFIEIANVFIISGLNASLIQKKEISETETSSIFYCCITLGALLYTVMFVAAPFIASAYELPVLTNVIRVFALRLPIASVQQVPAALLSRKLDFKKFFLSTSVGTVCSAVVGIVMAVLGFGVWALVAQNLISATLDAVILSIVVKWRPKAIFSLKAATPLINYGWKVMASDLIGTVFNNLSSMIVGYKYSPANLAYYTKGKNLPYMFRNNIYTTLISVLFPAMSNIGDDVVAVKAVARKSIRMLSYIRFPMMIGMTAVAENLVIVLYTEKWILMAPFIGIVCLECILSIIPTIVLQTLKAMGHSGMILKLEFIKKPLLLISILIAMNFGVRAIAWTLPINTALELVLNSIFSRKITGYTLFEQIKDSLVPLLLSFGMWGGILLVSFTNMPTVLELVVQVAVGVAFYVSLSAIFKVEEFTTLVNLVKFKLHR